MLRVPNIHKPKTYHVSGQTIGVQNVFFQSVTPPPSLSTKVDIHFINKIKRTRPLPFVLHMISDQQVDGEKAREQG